MGIILKRFGVVICLLIFAILLCGPCLGKETKTAYTRDGENFISKNRVDENIRAGINKPGDYIEVQVPLDTLVVGGYLQDTKYDKRLPKQLESKKSQPSNTTQTAPTSTSINGNKLILFSLLYFGLIVALLSAIKLGYL